MNRWIIALILTALAAAPLGATPILNCSTTTLDSLIGLPTSGCLAQDVVFSNFQYSYTGGTATVSANQITAELITDENPATGDRHGWIFSAPPKGWVGGTFTLSYTAQVVDKRPFVIAQLQTVNNPPNAPVSINERLNSGAPADLNVWYSSQSEHLTDFDTYGLPGYWHFDVVNTGASSNGAITRFDNYFYQTPLNLPEPAAQLLTGSALLALSLCVKRFKRR
jgi:hypothetical protein